MIQIRNIFLLLSLILTPQIPAAQPAKQPRINIAMTAAFVSESGIKVYKEINDYIAKKTGLDATFVYGLSYSSVNRMLEDGAINIAFVCGYPYTLSYDLSPGNVALLAAPIMATKQYEGKPIYYSYIITPKDSTAKTFTDLKGKHFIYNDQTSNSGYNMPRAHLIEIKETQGFFSKISKSGSHENSIRMVAEGKADASAIDSLVLDYARLNKEPFAHDVKIIETLGPSGIPPVVYSTKTPKDYVNRVQDALLKMNDDPEGLKILKKAYLEKFIEIEDSHYNDVRNMHKKALETGFMEIK